MTPLERPIKKIKSKQVTDPNEIKRLYKKAGIKEINNKSNNIFSLHGIHDSFLLLSRGGKNSVWSFTGGNKELRRKEVIETINQIIK